MTTAKLNYFREDLLKEEILKEEESYCYIVERKEHFSVQEECHVGKRCEQVYGGELHFR